MLNRREHHISKIKKIKKHGLSGGKGWPEGLVGGQHKTSVLFRNMLFTVFFLGMQIMNFSLFVQNGKVEGSSSIAIICSTALVIL